MLKKNILIISLGLIAVSSLVSLSLLRGERPTDTPSSNTTIAYAAIIEPDASAFSAYAQTQNIPVASVDLHGTPNAIGTAILIPQIHKSPGSQTSDTVNDAPERAQREIATILPVVSQYFGTNVIVTEGIQLQGVPDEYRVKLKTKAVALETLKGAIFALQASPIPHKDALDLLEQSKQQAERELYLEGAPFALIAQGQDYTIIGPEDPKTQSQAAAIVDRYITLKKANTALGTVTSSFQRSISLSDFLASRLKTPRSPIDPFITLAQNLQGSQNVDDQTIISSIPAWQDAMLTLQSPLPERMKLDPLPPIHDLPTEPGAVRAELDRLDGEIQRVIIDQRNQETALHTREAITPERPTIIVQYGAGHLEGLVKELQVQGLSVVIVTPNEVANRSTQPKGTA